MTRFTILVPCFNAEATLRETIASLQAQTDTDWECLLVDDGSTDATPAIIAAAAAKDPRFCALANPGKGPSDARNVALHAAQGELLAFCDADDLWVPGKLGLMARAFTDQPVAAVFGRTAFFDGVQTGAVSGLPCRTLSIPVLLGENPVCTMSNLVVRREVFAETGGFNRDLVHNEDLEWLIRLVGEGHRVVAIDEVLVKYRTSPTGLSSNLAAMQAGRKAALGTAARYGFWPSACSEAVHLRYLARRALRIDAPGGEALFLALRGVFTSPRGFFSNPRRGAATCAGALAATVLPRRLRRRLFAS